MCGPFDGRSRRLEKTTRPKLLTLDWMNTSEQFDLNITVLLEFWQNNGKNISLLILSDGSLKGTAEKKMIQPTKSPVTTLTVKQRWERVIFTLYRIPREKTFKEHRWHPDGPRRVGTEHGTKTSLCSNPLIPLPRRTTQRHPSLGAAPEKKGLVSPW